MLIPTKKYRKPICLAASIVVALLFTVIAANKLFALSISAHIAFFLVDAIFLAGYVISDNPVWSEKKLLRGTLAFALGITIGCVLQVLALFPNLELVSIDSSRWVKVDWIWLVAFALGPALLEEALLRGYLNDLLGHVGIPLLIILFVQGALFTAIHFVPNNIPRTGFFCLLAILFTLGRIHFGNLAWPIGAHFAWNFLAAIIYGAPASVAHSPGFVPPTAFGPRSYYLLIFCCLIISIYFLYKLYSRKGNGTISRTAVDRQEGK
jgi:membrane protease YdiL (CAAX protease family)